MAEHRDVAAAGGSVYDILFSQPSFINVHNELLDAVVPFLEESKERRLLVLGPGPIASPYHRVPEEFRDLFEGRAHKVVLADYNVANLAECFVTFNEFGMFGRGMAPRIVVQPGSREELLSTKVTMKGEEMPFIKYLSIAFQRQDSILDSSGMLGDFNNKVTFLEYDLRRPLPELGQFDVVDASYTLHHVAQYTRVLEDRIDEISGCLSDGGGLFHAGTGFVDMGYSELKVFKMARRMVDAKVAPEVHIVDMRDPSFPYTVIATAVAEGSKDVHVHEGVLGEEASRVVIDNEGYVHVPDAIAMKCGWLIDGNYHERDGSLVVPLIDPALQEDVDGLIRPVYGFYFPTNVEIVKFPPGGKVTPKLIKETVTNDRLERHYAERGLVEFYRPEALWGMLLEGAGFKRVEMRRPNANGKGVEALGNVVAYK